MKQLSIAILALLLSGMSLQAQDQKAKVKWYTMEEAQALAKKKPKKIMIDIYTSWCGPCRMMMQNTFTNPKVIEYLNKNYYAVKFNAEGQDTVKFNGQTFTNPNYDPAAKGRNATHQFTYYIATNPQSGGIAYPTLTFIDQNLKPITPVVGYKTPEQLLPILKYLGSDAYLTKQFDEFLKEENTKK